MPVNFEEMFSKSPGIPVSRTVVTEPGKPMTDDDLELLKILEENKPKICIVGTGGSGNNTLNRIQEVGVVGTRLVAMNTDAQHLLKTRADKRMILGRKKTKGLGAGSNPEVGEAAAQESEQEIKDIVGNADLVFVTCGMGGGTGTGSASVIARAAKQSGALCIAIVTTPFSSEGLKRKENAQKGLDKLKREADTTIVIPNDKLLEYVPDLPLNAAFKAADMVLANAVKGIAELITKPGLVNLDFADVRTILGDSGNAMIGLGEMEGSDMPDRVVQAAEKALTSPFLDMDVSSASKALINRTGGSDMTLGEAEAAVTAISRSIAPDAHIIWGATVDDGIKNRGVRVLAVLSGVREKAPAAQTAGEAVENIDFI